VQDTASRDKTIRLVAKGRISLSRDEELTAR